MDPDVLLPNKNVAKYHTIITKQQASQVVQNYSNSVFQRKAIRDENGITVGEE